MISLVVAIQGAARKGSMRRKDGTRSLETAPPISRRSSRRSTSRFIARSSLSILYVCIRASAFQSSFVVQYRALSQGTSIPMICSCCTTNEGHYMSPHAVEGPRCLAIHSCILTQVIRRLLHGYVRSKVFKYSDVGAEL